MQGEASVLVCFNSTSNILIPIRSAGVQRDQYEWGYFWCTGGSKQWCWQRVVVDWGLMGVSVVVGSGLGFHWQWIEGG